MRKTILLFLAVFLLGKSNAQSANELIQLVKNSQQKLKSASYRLVRRDTLVTGHVREMKGQVILETDPTDPCFGFKFWSANDGINKQTLYDGTNLFYIEDDEKKYTTSSNKDIIPHLLGTPGGQVVLTDLVRLDTAGGTAFRVTQDATYYYLHMSLADLTKYDVIKRSRTFLIDKKLLLPVGMISHQETLGKVQNLDYRIQKIDVNESAAKYDFSSNRYPDTYKKSESEPNRKLISLKDRNAPSFTLGDFDGNNISSDRFKGKLLLLDFWEVWCGPCVESMPKVQQWHEKYKAKGLEVLGIIHQKEFLPTAKQLIAKRKIGFPMLIGSDQTKKDYGITAVPVYVLIGKDGKVIMTSEGFDPLMEEAIQKHL